MPAVYVSGKFTAKVSLTKDQDFLIEEWNNKKLAAERLESKRPNLSIWIEIPNPEDEVSPFAVPLNDIDRYDGVFKYDQDGNNFLITFDGKAKATVHKSTKEAIDAGHKGVVASISVNGAGYGFDQPLPCELTIQSKKI